MNEALNSWSFATEGSSPKNNQQNERSTNDLDLTHIREGIINTLVINPPFAEALAKAHQKGTLKIDKALSKMGDYTSLDIYDGKEALGLIILAWITPSQIARMEIADGGGLIIILDVNIRKAS